MEWQCHYLGQGIIRSYSGDPLGYNFEGKLTNKMLIASEGHDE